jgi:hypothetical protein
VSYLASISKIASVCSGSNFPDIPTNLALAAN